ncbi:G2/mitotic-specific cyclin-B3-like [Lineus longissimus]|uniref:G2/mitotic-specific cyclin-B3-like n=1 Tax=Lineus longissimus TaxID=88925 RepID=UPI002B4F54DF
MPITRENFLGLGSLNLPILGKQQQNNKGNGGLKRMAEKSPPMKQAKKRAAFGDITNKENAKIDNKDQKKKPTKLVKKTITTRSRKAKNKSKDEIEICSSLESSQSSKSSQELTSSQSQDTCTSSQSSQEVISSQSSTTSIESQKSVVDDDTVVSSREEPAEDAVKSEESDGHNLEIIDIDKENVGDSYQCPEYAYDIFEYYKEREISFMVQPYMERQPEINNSMRAIVVDWLVEIQENFELNHETLYLAIRLVDKYLEKSVIKREQLQLVASTALFIACKFDERVPPLLDDFLYICDDAYTRAELTEMERNILKSIGFDLGIPSSYRFLRRYSKCCKCNMETLTMGRFILEMSQMDYEYLTYKESEMGAACLYLALKMKKTGDWTPTLIYYTGYKEEQILPLVRKLNAMVGATTSKFYSKTIKTKYSHKVFFEVAKMPPLDIWN